MTGSSPHPWAMTSIDTQTQSTQIQPLPTGPADPRPAFHAAVALAVEMVAEVRPDQWEAPTPCDELNVRALTGHLLTVLRRVTALGRGENPMAMPTVADDVQDGDWVAALSSAGDAAAAAWNDPEVLTRMMRLPWAQRPGAQMLASYLNELSVHSWDLATATGQHPIWDPAVLEIAHEAALASLPPATGRAAGFDRMRSQLPAEMRNATAPFADAVDVPADAPLIDRLVAYSGRRP